MSFTNRDIIILIFIIQTGKYAMGTIIDYLRWRGDILFLKDPFNDIDALILSLLSYLQLKDVIPKIGSNERISLKDASLQYFLKDQKTKKKTSSRNPSSIASFNSELLELFRAVAVCPRFEDIQLSRHKEDTDFVVERQFAAVTYTLPVAKHEKIVAFRGTDNSWVGWKEDFALAYMEQIPAQESAVNYLQDAIGIFSGKVTVCGHSKGGNLAVYAGTHINKLSQRKIKKIISFDGPGFDFSFVPKAPFLQNSHKVVTFVPEESMVGLLLESIGRKIVISSSARAIYQHDAFNWNVQQKAFVTGELSKTAKLLEHTLKSWLAEISLSERKIFIDALFDILRASEGTTTYFKENIKKIDVILKKYSKMDEEKKTVLSDVFLSLTEKTKNTVSTTIKEKLPRKN